MKAGHGAARWLKIGGRPKEPRNRSAPAGAPTRACRSVAGLGSLAVVAMLAGCAGEGGAGAPRGLLDRVHELARTGQPWTVPLVAALLEATVDGPQPRSGGTGLLDYGIRPRGLPDGYAGAAPGIAWVRTGAEGRPYSMALLVWLRGTPCVTLREVTSRFGTRFERFLSPYTNPWPPGRRGDEDSIVYRLRGLPGRERVVSFRFAYHECARDISMSDVPA